MKTGNRGNALLIELLIVVMFFMLASTVLLQVFSAARSQGERAGWLNEALNGAQNVADQLYAAQDSQILLKTLGFEKAEDGWTLEWDGYRTEVTEEREEKPSGTFFRRLVRVSRSGETLVTLPCSRFEEGKP